MHTQPDLDCSVTTVYPISFTPPTLTTTADSFP
jgi:hypothetical protein